MIAGCFRYFRVASITCAQCIGKVPVKMEIVIYVVVAIVCLAVGFVVSRVVSGNGAKSAMAEAERKLADAGFAPVSAEDVYIVD